MKSPEIYFIYFHAYYSSKHRNTSIDIPNSLLGSFPIDFIYRIWAVSQSHDTAEHTMK